MKAKAYVHQSRQRLLEGKELSAELTDTFFAFLKEIPEIAAMRHAQRYEAYTAIFREQALKFKRYQQQLLGGEKATFNEILQRSFPELYDALYKPDVWAIEGLLLLAPKRAWRVA